MLVFSVNASDGLAVLARNGLRYGRVVVVGDSLRGLRPDWVDRTDGRPWAKAQGYQSVLSRREILSK